MSNKCPYCYSDIGTWKGDPIVLPEGAEYDWISEDTLVYEPDVDNRWYKGFQQIREGEIIELQEYLKELEESMIAEEDRTAFSLINADGKFQITGKQIKEMRDSVEKILTASGITKTIYFNSDNIGTHIIHPKGDKLDWTDPITEDTDLQKFQVKYIHIEDLRHTIFGIFLETWSINPTSPWSFTKNNTYDIIAPDVINVSETESIVANPIDIELTDNYLWQIVYWYGIWQQTNGWETTGVAGSLANVNYRTALVSPEGKTAFTFSGQHSAYCQNLPYFKTYHSIDSHDYVYLQYCFNDTLTPSENIKNPLAILPNTIIEFNLSESSTVTTTNLHDLTRGTAYSLVQYSILIYFTTKTFSYSTSVPIIARKLSSNGVYSTYFLNCNSFAELSNYSRNLYDLIIAGGASSNESYFINKILIKIESYATNYKVHIAEYWEDLNLYAASSYQVTLGDIKISPTVYTSFAV